jgi:pyruvate,water dikinase
VREEERPVLDLAEIRGTDAGRVGPKVARLGQLAHAGWRVPDGYAVTASALGRWLPAAIREELGRLLAGGSAYSVSPAAASAGHQHLVSVTRQARELIEAQPLPAWLTDAVHAAHGRLASRTGHGAALKVAVRSSALAEDGASASFAGQYATYLGVTGVADVLAHIRKCWASGFSAHALEYRRRQAGPAAHSLSGGSRGSSPREALVHHQLAVGVLELVDVRSAGVVFTIDPVTGDRDRLVIEANWGFGESVVSGQVTPDHWEVDRATGHILAEHVVAKRAWAVFNAASGAVVLRPLPEELAGQSCLAPHEVRYLCRQAAEIEDAEDGIAQDVEWAIAKGLPFPDSLFILQHRPETTWSQKPKPEPAPDPEPAAPDPAPGQAFDPVQYALRNVFKVPGA